MAAAIKRGTQWALGYYNGNLGLWPPVKVPEVRDLARSFIRFWRQGNGRTFELIPRPDRQLV